MSAGTRLWAAMAAGGAAAGLLAAQGFVSDTGLRILLVTLGGACVGAVLVIVGRKGQE